MTKQIVNLGTSANSNNGDPLRTAFNKVNSNFDEVYTLLGAGAAGTISSVVGPLFNHTNHNNLTVTLDPVLDQIVLNADFTGSNLNVSSLSGNVTGNVTGDLKGSVVGDDSTVLVDGVNSTIPWTGISGVPTTISGLGVTDVYTKTEIDNSISQVTSDHFSFAITSDDSTVVTVKKDDTIQFKSGSNLTSATDADGNVTYSLNSQISADLAGSVFADDSTLLVDGTNGTLNSSALTKPIALADNEKIIFGSDNDLEIFHNASNGNTIIDNNTGNLVIKGSNLFLQSASSEYFFRGAANGAVTLYYDNVAKLDTTTDGVAITGKITGLTDPTAAQDAATKAYVDANSGGGGGLADVVSDTTPQLGGDLDVNGNSIVSVSDGDINLAPNGAGEVTVTGNATISNVAKAYEFIVTNANGALKFGDNTGSEGYMNIYLNNVAGGARHVIQSYPTAGGGFKIQNNVNDQAITFETKDSGGTTQTPLTLNGDGSVAVGGIQIKQGVEEKFATTNGATGVTALDCSTGHVHYLTAPAGDITANFTNLGLTAEYATNVTVIIDQGNTEYEITAVQIGGAAQTIVWQGNSAPTGTANGVDSFSFTILNDGGTYVVLGQMVAFGGV